MQGPLVVRGLSSSSPSIKYLEVTVRVLPIRSADHTKAGELVHSRDPVPHSHTEPTGSPGKQGLIKKKGKESILIQLNAKLHRKKRAQSQARKEELQAGSSQNQISLEMAEHLNMSFYCSARGVSGNEWREGERGCAFTFVPGTAETSVDKLCRALASIL